MNTIFKFFLEAWYIFTIATAYFIYFLFKQILSFLAETNKTIVKTAIAIWVFTFSVLCLFSVITVFIAIVGFSRSDHTSGYKPVFTINGLKYLQYQNPKEYLAIKWIKENIKAPANILEAQLQQNNAYNVYGRIVKNTGLPTLIGWEHHLKQRARAPELIKERYDNLITIYSSKNTEQTYTLLNKYNIDYVYYGDVEIKEFGTQGINKFDSHKELFKLVYSNPEVRIYKVL